MRRRLMLVAIVLLVCGLSGPARAAGPSATGWWWVGRSGGAPTPPPPTVPEHGLYVAGDPTGAEAMAALRFEVAEDLAPRALQLAIASSQGTPVVIACKVKAAWQPVEGGAWETRPDAGCADHAVAGAVSPDGTSVTFNVAPLAEGAHLDIAIVPAVDPSASVPATFQLAFAPPGPDALSTAPLDSGGAADAAAAAVPTPAAVASPSMPVIDVPPASVLAPFTGSTDAAVTPALPPSGLVPAAGVVRAAATKADGKRWLALVILVVAALGVSRALITTDTGERGIGPFVRLRVQTATVPAAPVVRGIGRFAKPRVTR